MLERSPNDISLLDVIEAIDGPLTAGLPMNVNFPEPSGDRLQETLCQIADTTRRQLAAVKLTHLMSSPAGKDDTPDIPAAADEPIEPIAAGKSKQPVGIG